MKLLNVLGISLLSALVLAALPAQGQPRVKLPAQAQMKAPVNPAIADKAERQLPTVGENRNSPIGFAIFYRRADCMTEGYLIPDPSSFLSWKIFRSTWEPARPLAERQMPGTGGYLEFRSNDVFSQDLTYKDDKGLNNDNYMKSISIMINNDNRKGVGLIKNGTLLELYDDTGADQNKDWAELTITDVNAVINNVDNKVCIPNLDQNFEGNGVSYQIKARRNGLAGALSLIKYFGK